MKGTDYFTAADKQEIAQAAAGLVPMDTTLTQTGKAADAKAVGDALASSMRPYLITIYEEVAINYSDRSFAEIKAAYDAGYFCIVDYYGTMLPLLYCSDTEAAFSGVPDDRATMVLRVVHDVENGYDYVTTSWGNFLQTSAVSFGDGTFGYYYDMNDYFIANRYHQDYNRSILRNSKIVASDTTPDYNGEICWTYG